jgi:uncharacterized protein (DUF1800 family)
MNAIAIAQNRFGLGARPDESAPGAPQRWLLDQLARYEAAPIAWSAQPRTGELMAEYAGQQRMVREAGEAQKVAARQALQRQAREVYLAAVGARATAALDTPAPFAERLVHFWANHFAVSVDKLTVVGLAGVFELEAIRPHVLGRFEDMLLAVTRHPAMLLYLDQANSIGPGSMAARRLAQRADAPQRGLNENLAREIMELHTLGVRSGYTQDDVTEFSRALTGWGVARPAQPRLAAVSSGMPAAGTDLGFEYHPALHEPGPRTIVGRRYADAGEAQARAVLHDLATAPATARHIGLKLARHFMADDPPDTVVQRLAAAFERSGGDLPAVYRALVESPEAWRVAHPKFKTPWDWAVSSLRALGRREVPPMQMAALMNQLGQPVWRPGSPAGYDDVAATWAAPDALLRRVEVAQRLAAQAGDRIDARVLAPQLLPGALSDATATAIARAESPGSALALLLVSPEFLRR